jgi:hypothetical protein
MRSASAFIFVFMLLPTWTASAKPLDLGVLVGAGEVPTHGDIARSYGAEIEAALVPFTGSRGCSCQDCETICVADAYPYYFGVGAFGAISDGTVTKTRRDLYGLHGSAGLALKPARWFIPFITVGLDALYVDTELASDTHDRGVTLGADARAGVLGYLGAHAIYSVSVSYLGAVAPGVGDNAGGLSVWGAIGWRFVLEQ